MSKKWINAVVRLHAFLLPLLFVSGCASTRMSDTDSDDLFRQGHYQEAANKLKKGMDKAGEDHADRLLYLFDIGLALHQAGQYEESNKFFLEAEDLSDIKDYTSLADEAATVLVSDNIKDYKGEDFEKVLVNIYLALNFAMLGKIEDALVEARKVNRKLYMMITAGKRPYQLNPFAYYLSAILYETEKEWNDAYIDYKKVYELRPSFPGLGRDLWRSAYQSKIYSNLKKYEKEFHLETDDVKAIKEEIKNRSKKAEIIVVYQNGISPIKRPSEVLHSIPVYKPRSNPITDAMVYVDEMEVGRTNVLFDIENTAISNLEENYAPIIAKKVVGVAAKVIIADQVSKKTGNDALGALTQVLLFSADQADLRSWKMLPQNLQIIRYWVDPGVHTVRLSPNGQTEQLEKTVRVDAGQKVFTSFRTVP